jgi:hypothetical protein
MLLLRRILQATQNALLILGRKACKSPRRFTAMGPVTRRTVLWLSSAHLLLEPSGFCWAS